MDHGKAVGASWKSLLLLLENLILQIGNKGVFVNTQVVTSETDLAAAIERVLSDWDEPKFRLESVRGAGWDFVAYVTLDGKTHRFGVDCKLRPTVRNVEQLSARHDGELEPLLATVKASSTLLQHCRRLDVGCVDLNGRIWLRSKGFLIDKEAPRRDVRFRTTEAPHNLFSLKGARLARALLSFPDRRWRQTELAGFTGLSQGLLSRLLKQAGEDGWVAGSRGDWGVTNADSLLDAWKAADVFEKRAVVYQYSVLESDLKRLAQRVLDAVRGEVAFTQWFAAGLRFPYSDVPIVSAYVLDTFRTALEEKLGARAVGSGGKLWLITPKDDGVFQAKRRVDGIPIVCDVQIYLDLLQVGLRGPDQAEALRSWEGFNRS